MYVAFVINSTHKQSLTFLFVIFSEISSLLSAEHMTALCSSSRLKNAAHWAQVNFRE